MELSETPKTFCKFFISFLESTLNVEHFEKRHEPHSSNISEVIDFERCANLNA